MGIREWVGLGILVLAVAVGLSFFTYNDNRTVRPLATPTPAAVVADTPPTVAPLPSKTLAIPEGWVLTYVRGDPAHGQGELPTFSQFLDIEENGAPFPDFRDGNWGVAAEINIVAEPGSYAFSFELQGKARLLANGQQVGEWTSLDRKTKITGTIPNAGGALALRLEAVDPVGKALIVRWK